MERLLTPDQVCEILGVTKDWLYDKSADGTIRGFKLTPNGALRFRESAIEAYIESRENA
jgi:excisionase family DNA binding protein